MASYPVTNIRIEPELKAEAKDILEDLGLNLSSAITIYLKAIVRQRGIPFDITMNDSNIIDRSSSRN